MNLTEIKGYDLLVKAILSVETEEECAALIEDLMTIKEINDMAQRMLVAKLLSEQTVYNKIVEETGASTATISRVSKALENGRGGYHLVLERTDTLERND